LDLYSNFTYFDNPSRTNGDQFGQKENRHALGGSLSQSWSSQVGTTAMVNTLGMQFREDYVRLGLYDTVARVTEATVRDDTVQQIALGLYNSNELTWSPWLRSVIGLRVDQLSARVVGNSSAMNSGNAQATHISPKLSLIAGPWNDTEFFFNTGHGFHSNDARGMTHPTAPVPGLVSTRGQEVGIKTQAIPHLQTTLVFWQLDMDSELVYVGDAGNTEAGRPSRRTGLEWSNHWTPNRHWSIDANLAWTRPRYTDGLPSISYIVNAVTRVAHLSVAMHNIGPWSGSLGMRYIGTAPLTEDNTMQARPSLTSNLRLNRHIHADFDVTLDVLNLTNRLNHDISYYYASKPTPLSTAQDDIHVHPAEPRTLRIGARWRY
jgi:hypothetical protein